MSEKDTPKERSSSPREAPVTAQITGPRHRALLCIGQRETAHMVGLATVTTALPGGREREYGHCGLEDAFASSVGWSLSDSDGCGLWR
jgi:hypothetical protein